MSTNTYVAIESQTTTSTVASITLGSGGTIPQTYTDLVLVVSGKSSGIYNWGLRFNGDTGANYSRTLLYGNGSSAASNRQTSTNIVNPGFLTPEGSRTTIQIMDYSNTTTNKSFLTRGGDFSDSVSLGVGMWRPSNLATGNITSITLFSDGGSYISAGSTFTLYGIANTTKLAPKALGGIITQDDTYTYHAFRASGTFTPQQELTVECLVVAGGGGGPTLASRGAGGAGGYRSATGLSVTATNYTVTVGAGGTSETNGGDSTFSTITSTGGGKGGVGASPYTPGNGGSGGGANFSSGIGLGNTPSTSPSQGNNGGTASTSGNFGGGGGGGAGGSWR